jgi:two-component system, cell cycle response regulator
MMQENIKPAILIVDDNEDILEYLSRFLGAHYTIITAHDGKEALTKIADDRIQLVVSDVMMPEMDGFELCKYIKTHQAYSYLPVVLLTAKNTLQAKIEGLEIGADVYIEKPFSPEFLYMQINSLLVNRSKISNYYANNPLAHIKTLANSKPDEQLLEQLNLVVLDHIEDTELDVEHLARYLNMSRPTLYRRLKEITDMTPNDLINIVRLQKAAILLNEGHASIQEISDMVGYNSVSHFARNFQKRFGKLPSEFSKKKG